MTRPTSCQAVQDRLQEWLDGTLAAGERRSVQSHLDTCPRCRDLAALMRMDLSGDESLPDLAAAVLERTTGSPCIRAREILCDYVDDALDGMDRELLTLHLDRCRECAATAMALTGLAQDLPSMAALTPDGGFVGDVLAATSSRRHPWSDLATRWADAWAGLLARPRIAWEAGYIGAMALWLVFSTVGAPLLASRPPLPSREASAELIDEVQGRVSALGQQAWSATGGQGLSAWQEFQSGLTDRYRGTAAAREDLRVHGVQLKNAALELDLVESGQALRGLKEDTRTVLSRLVASPDETDSTDD